MVVGGCRGYGKGEVHRVWLNGEFRGSLIVVEEVQRVWYKGWIGSIVEGAISGLLNNILCLQQLKEMCIILLFIES